jgi:mannose-1-phosphate guanylyltransferase
MKAMILAAGLGTRLRPVTDNRPKALVEVAGRTLLEITLVRLRSFGICEVIINVHHFADMVIDYLKANQNFGMRIEVSREDVLLDTGGGLKKATWFFLKDSKDLDEPFILHNVDVISTIDFARVVQSHKTNRALATLAVQDRASNRYLLFDEHLRLCGRRSAAAAQPSPSRHAEKAPNTVIASEARDLLFMNDQQESRAQPLAFSGIHIISPRLLPMLTEDGAFSIITSYLRLAAQGESIMAFRADEYYWRDLGKPDDLRQAARDFKEKVLSI